MKPEAQRIAIAEACPTVFYIRRQTMQVVKRCQDGTEHLCPTYDPLSDLNAMHEAEKVLRGTDEQYYNEREYYDRWTRYTVWLYNHYGVSATAAQRAEAFLRALNLWDDTK